jgi:hypothetical protein
LKLGKKLKDAERKEKNIHGRNAQQPTLMVVVVGVHQKIDIGCLGDEEFKSIFEQII